MSSCPYTSCWFFISIFPFTRRRLNQNNFINFPLIFQNMSHKTSWILRKFISSARFFFQFFKPSNFFNFLHSHQQEWFIFTINKLYKSRKSHVITTSLEYYDKGFGPLFNKVDLKSRNGERNNFVYRIMLYI